MADTTTPPKPNPEEGFTLIEILVVIIIIGILAAIAIPIFLNQQRTARDAATKSDVRNMVASVETALANDPDALTGDSNPSAGVISLHATPGGTQLSYLGTGARTEVWLQVGEAKPIKVSKTEGTRITAVQAGKGYLVVGYNEDGREHRDPASGFRYRSLLGGTE